MKKFTIIDYIIIILVICAAVFAFIHITTDDSTDLKETAFDKATINKIPETYFNYYEEGYVVKATVEGFNSTDGSEVTLDGIVQWIDDDGGSDVKLLVDSDKTYLLGIYKNVPNADIYIDHISLENNGTKYNDLREFIIKPMKINSLKDLTKNLSGSNYEISTTISLDSLDITKIQEISNKLNSEKKRAAIKLPNENSQDQIELIKADENCINEGDAVLGNINGITSEIILRVYDCSDSQIDNIKNNYEVTNIRTF